MQLNLIELRSSDAISKKYDLSSFVAICGLTNITLTEWLGLEGDVYTANFGIPQPILKALVKEVESLSNRINRERAEKEQQAKLEAQSLGTNLNFGKPNSSLSRVYGG